MKYSKDIRELMGLTQKQFAEKINASIRTVQAWDRKARAPGNKYLETLDAVYAEYGIQEEENEGQGRQRRPDQTRGHSSVEH